MGKRILKTLFCLNESELAELEELKQIYSVNGVNASKSSVIRYALKSLPRQPLVFPF